MGVERLCCGWGGVVRKGLLLVEGDGWGGKTGMVLILGIPAEAEAMKLGVGLLGCCIIVLRKGLCCPVISGMTGTVVRSFSMLAKKSISSCGCLATLAGAVYDDTCQF